MALKTFAYEARHLHFFFNCIRKINSCIIFVISQLISYFKSFKTVDNAHRVVCTFKMAH